MIAWLSYLAADVMVRALPHQAADALAVGLARAAFALRLPARRVAEANFARLTGASGGRPRVLARASFEHFALALVDFLRLGRADEPLREADVEVEGLANLEAARASGRGVIVLSAHLGSWERGAAFLSARVERMHIVAREHPSGRVEAFFARRRGRFGLARLGGPLWSAAAGALRRREWVALMGDRTIADGRGSVCAWAAVLARRTGAVVLPAVAPRRTDGRWLVRFEAPLSPEACADGGYRSAVRRWIASWPDQWCAFEPPAEGVA